jgi:hypothetical protein
MSAPHPLNQAVIAQALHALRSGQLRHCQAMGLSANIMEALKHPALANILANARVMWCSVNVNVHIAERLLEQGRNVEKEIDTIDRMLRLGASTEMVSEFYGLTHQDVAVRRQMLGLAQRKGRWPVLSEEEDTTLWERWHTNVKTLGIDLHDDTAMLGVAMDLAEALDLPLSEVWSAIGEWVEQGLT